MAAEPNSGHRQQQQAISVNSSNSPTTKEMIAIGCYYSDHGVVNVNSGMSAGSLIFSGTRKSSNTNQGDSLVLDTVPGLKHDTGLAAEWTVDEQYRLEEELDKHADEPNILKYIKIASKLHDKTVRDVALRCRWMTRKRRKQEEYNLGKKVKDRKDKLAESSLKRNLPSTSPFRLSAYPLSISHHDQIKCTSSGALIGTTRHLLEENNQALGQISANLSTLKLQENVELFFCMRNNITSILNDMKSMPGIMSQMPPLPVFVNEEVVKLLPSSSQLVTFGSSSGIYLKQEPGC